MKRSVKGRALVFIGALALTTLAAGHGRPPTAHAQRRVVRLWHAYGDAEAAGLRAALTELRRVHPEIEVQVLRNAFGAYAAKLESAIPTGTGPDLFIDAHERLVTYVEMDLVTPLREPRERVVRMAPDDYEASDLAAVSIGDARYGVPLSVKSAALYVNDALCPTDPTTLEEIEALRVPRGAYPLVFEAENAYYTAALVHAYGGQMIDDRGRYALARPEPARAVRHLRRLVTRGVVPEETSGELVKNLFAGGRAATAISGPWLAPDLPDSLRWHVVPLPRVRGAGGAPMRPYSTVEAVYLARGARDRGAAVLVADFLGSREGAIPRAIHGRQVVASRSAWDDPRLAADRTLSAFRRAAAQALPMPTHPRMRYTFEPALHALRKVLRGGVGIEDALAESERRFENTVRPPPPPRNPTFGVLALGLLVLLAAITAVRRMQDPERRLALRRSLPAYAWVAHAFLAVGLLVVAPLAVGAATSFFAGPGTDLHYVGLANYVDIVTARGRDLLGHGSFWMVLLVTVLWTVLNVVFHVAIGLALALVLHRPAMKLRGVYRVILILPWAVPSYVTALAWKGMFHRQFGAVNAILDALGAEPVSWFAQWSTAFAANVTTNVWLGFPFMMVVTLGALTAIPKELYEAAAVDGATPWQRFRLITLPMLRPMLAPAVAMGAVWTFNMFNVVFLVSGGEPDGSTEILVSEAYRWAFTRGSQYGYAAAYAVLIFGILFLGTRLIGRGVQAESARSTRSRSGAP